MAFIEAGARLLMACIGILHRFLPSRTGALGMSIQCPEPESLRAWRASPACQEPMSFLKTTEVRLMTGSIHPHGRPELAMLFPGGSCPRINRELPFEGCLKRWKTNCPLGEAPNFEAFLHDTSGFIRDQPGWLYYVWCHRWLDLTCGRTATHAQTS